MVRVKISPRKPHDQSEYQSEEPMTRVKSIVRKPLDQGEISLSITNDQSENQSK
jgi:hypothetical protein